MDSEYLRSQNCELPANLCEVSRVVLCADASGAEAFLTHAFPHFSQCIVASGDRRYPLDETLNERVFTALETDPKLKLAVFGLSALRNLKTATDRILVLDDLVMQDFRKHPGEREQGLALSATSLVFLIKSFFLQWEKMARIGNTAFAYANFAEYEERRMDWKAALVGVDCAEKMVVNKSRHKPH